MSEIKLTPFLKWAGGKRWFVHNYRHLIPDDFNVYHEPFLGSGVVFFDLLPERAVLSDVNVELINVYQAIRDNYRKVEEYLEGHSNKHSNQHYYDVRAAIPSSRYAKAARTIYLNRTCWNALYRVNKKGYFNVPIGTKNSVLLPTDNFKMVSKKLKNVEISCGDFESVVDCAKSGDFVFVDPPYTVKHNNNGFVKYNEKIFSWDDQVRLRDAVVRASSRGAKVLVTNADHESVKELYLGFKQHTLTRASIISGAANGRGKYNELAVQSWL